MQQLALAFDHKTDYSSANFIPLNSNAEALLMLNNAPEQAIVFYGKTAVGKTHLLHMWAEKYAAEFVSATALPAHLTAEAYAVDDVDLADAQAQEKLFHLFNRIKEQGGLLSFASTKPIAQLQEFLPDLQSRLLTLHQVEIKEPSVEEMRLLLVKETYDRQISVAPQVVDYILTHSPRQPAYLMALLDALDKRSMVEQRKITIPFVKQILEN